MTKPYSFDDLKKDVTDGCIDTVLACLVDGRGRLGSVVKCGDRGRESGVEARQPFGAERVGQEDPVGHQPPAGSPSARIRSAAPTPRPSSTGAPK